MNIGKGGGYRFSAIVCIAGDGDGGDFGFAGFELVLYVHGQISPLIHPSPYLA